MRSVSYSLPVRELMSLSDWVATVIEKFAPRALLSKAVTLGQMTSLNSSMKSETG